MDTRKMIAVAAISICAAIPVAANAAVGTVDVNGVTWTVNTNPMTKTATLGNGSSACIATATSIDASLIPWTFTVGEGDDAIEYTVTAIAEKAFDACSKLAGTLTIPDAVTSMGKYAFRGCSTLTCLASLGGVTTLEEEVFCNDSGLQGSDYPDLSKIKVLGKNVFKQCSMGGKVRLDSISGSMSAENAFVYAAITNISFPRAAFSISGQWVFGHCKKLTGVFLPGPDSEGASLIRRSNFFNDCTSLKVFLAGPRTGIHPLYGGDDTTMFAYVTGCRIFVPAGDLTLPDPTYYCSWDNLDDYVSGQTIIHYGSGRELDLSFNHDARMITATPATAHAFTNVLAAASTIKDVFGYDTRINVTNALEIAAGSVTAAELVGVTFDSLTFAVKTQAQLDTVLAAVPAETPLAIDPEGATENLMITTVDRKIYVMLPKSGTYKVRKDGLIIIVQ